MFLVKEANGLKHMMTLLLMSAPGSSRFFSGKNVAVGCLSLNSDQSWICICYTNRRQWRLCHVIPLNKGESTGNVEVNYSLAKVRSLGKRSQLKNLELESVENQHYGTPNLIFACVSQEILHLAPFFFTGLQFNHRKAMKSRGQCLYNLNSCPSRQLLLQGGDISVNPGPAVLKPSAPRCSRCEKPVAKNHKRCICSVCFDVTHVKCSKILNPKHVLSSVPKEWVCPQCTVTVLPFYNHNLSLSNTSCTSESPMTEDTTLVDEHLSALSERSRQFRLCHINTQSMVSSFDELLATIKEYPFDIVTISETWLKDNPLRLQYVTIPGYSQVFRNRDRFRGGGGGWRWCLLERWCQLQKENRHREHGSGVGTPMDRESRS